MEKKQYDCVINGVFEIRDACPECHGAGVHIKPCPPGLFFSDKMFCRIKEECTTCAGKGIVLKDDECVQTNVQLLSSKTVNT